MIKYILIAITSAFISGLYYYRTLPEMNKARRALLAGLRALFIASLIVLLVNPIFYYIRLEKIRPRVVILRDVSQSMEQKTGGQSKKELLSTQIEMLEKLYKEKGYEVITQVFAGEKPEDRSNSLLLPAISGILKDLKERGNNTLSAFVLASDGWFRDTDYHQIRNANIPFIVLSDSTRTSEVDLMVNDVQNNRYSYRNEPTLFKAEIKSQSYNGKAKIELWIGNTKTSERQIDVKTNVTAEVEFIHRFGSTGFYPVKVIVMADGLKERSINNNTYSTAVDVLSEKESIAVISDKPSWDNKYIIDAISLNQRWEVNHFSVQKRVLVAGNKIVPSFAKASQSAIIVINNGSLDLGATIASQIIQSYNKGISILYIGIPVPELEPVLPVSVSNIKTSYQGLLSLSSQVESYPAFKIDYSEQSRIPPLDYYYVIAKSSATIIATISNPQNSPAIAIMQTGNRKSVAFSFLNLWRWQMQSPTGAYNDMISNIITWLGNKGGDRFKAIHNNSFMLGEKVEIRLRVDDDIRSARLDLSPRLEIFDADKKKVFTDFMSLSKGEYRSSIGISEAGNYTYIIADAKTGDKVEGHFMISEVSLEDRDLDFNHPLLIWLAAQSNGKVLDQRNIAEFVPVPAPETALEKQYEIPFYRKWYVITLLILIFSLELFFRRRWGLL